MKNEDEGSSELRPASESSIGKENARLDVMLKLMEGMQELQKHILDKGNRENENAEVVRQGAHDLPLLPEPVSESGPLDLGDWLMMVEPMMADLSDISGDWWVLMVEESRKWYRRYMAEDPIKRAEMSTEKPEALDQKKWGRLEKRAMAMMVKAVPESIRDELMAMRASTAFGTLCRLQVLY